MSLEKMGSGFMKNLMESQPKHISNTMMSLDELNKVADKISSRAAQEIFQAQKLNKQTKLPIENTIPKRYSLASIHELHVHDDLVIQKVKQYVNAFGANSSQVGQNMVLIGEVGTGKTQLACSVANALKEKNYFVGYVTAAELFAQVTSAKQFSSKETESSLYTFYEKYDLLIIDEVGQKTPSAYELNILQTIIDIRSRNLKPIIAISNLSQKMLPLAIGERAWSRLAGFDSVLLNFQGDDLRLLSSDVTFITSTKKAKPIVKGSDSNEVKAYFDQYVF